MSMQIQIGNRRTCVQKKRTAAWIFGQTPWPSLAIQNMPVANDWQREGRTNEPTEWLRTKRCWMLHECLSNWPGSKMNKRQTKRLVCLGRTFVVCIQLTCVKVALATACPPCPWWRRRTITNKVLSIIIRQPETHTHKHSYTARQINSGCKAKCVRLTCFRCALSAFFRCLYPAAK